MISVIWKPRRHHLAIAVSLFNIHFDVFKMLHFAIVMSIANILEPERKCMQFNDADSSNTIDTLTQPENYPND